MPAESCAKIKASEQGKAVSGKYWLKPQETKMASNKFPVSFLIIIVSFLDYFDHVPSLLG